MSVEVIPAPRSKVNLCLSQKSLFCPFHISESIEESPERGERFIFAQSQKSNVSALHSAALNTAAMWR